MGIALLISTIGMFASLFIATGKNRSAGWAAVGFFMPVIGIIIALALEPRPPAGEPQR